jgi:hypothetical protein
MVYIQKFFVGYSRFDKLWEGSHGNAVCRRGECSSSIYLYREYIYIYIFFFFGYDVINGFDTMGSELCGENWSLLKDICMCCVYNMNFSLFDEFI